MRARTIAGALVAGLAGAAVVAGVAWWRSDVVLARTYEVAVPAPEPVDDLARVRRGEHLVRDVLRCGDCHGADLGGAYVAGASGVGRVWAPNLTLGEGGVAAALQPADWARAIRRGVGTDGHGLVGMPAHRWAGLAPRDLADVVAALDRWPLVDRPARATEVGVALRWKLAMGRGVAAAELGEPPPPTAAPAWGPTAAYGAYLATLAGCHDCHRDGVTSGLLGLDAPTLRPGELAGWTGAAFGAAVRDGVGPDGEAVTHGLPGGAFAGLTDTELDALWWHYRPPGDDATAEAP